MTGLGFEPSRLAADPVFLPTMLHYNILSGREGIQRQLLTWVGPRAGPLRSAKPVYPCLSNSRSLGMEYKEML